MDGESNNSVNQSPWESQAPYLQSGYSRADTGFTQGLNKQFYPHNTYTPFSTQTEQALGLQEQRALQGSPLLRQAQTNALGSLSGQLNPALSGMIEQVGQKIAPRVGSAFSSAGRYGSGLHANALASALTDAGVQLAYQDYGKAMSQAPQLAALDYFDIGQLANAGAVREGKHGEQIAENVNRWNFEQNKYDDALQRYMALVAGGSPGSTRTETMQGNPLMQSLGLGLNAAGTYGNLFGAKGAFPQTGQAIGNWFGGMF